MTKSVCWQFTTIDQPNPSTIVGTIHLSIREVMERWDAITQLMLGYDTVYTESSLSQQDQVYQQQFIMLPDPQVRTEYISERRWAKMRATFLRYYRVDINQMAHVRPLFILTATHQSMLEQMQGQSLDQQIWDFAVANDKRVHGIETAQEQVEILLQLPLETQYRQLVKFSKRISGQEKKINDLVQAYKHQDIDKMYRLSKRSMGLSRSLLLHDRNRVMSDRMLDWHNEEPSFFSFGAGHLGGQYGVLNLLKKAGAQMSPVELT